MLANTNCQSGKLAVTDSPVDLRKPANRGHTKNNKQRPVSGVAIAVSCTRLSPHITMARRILPRYLILVAILTTVVIGLMLSIFYGQYRWLTAGIVGASVGQHDTSLAASFERRARGQLHRIADSLSAADPNDLTLIRSLLNREITSNENLTGLRLLLPDGLQVQSGLVVEQPTGGDTIWRAEQLYMSYPVVREESEIGVLISSFSLATLAEESSAFEERLVAQGTESRHVSFFWIGAATLVTLGLCGFGIWIVTRAQAERIPN